jgi:hypothetical protein
MLALARKLRFVVEPSSPDSSAVRVLRMLQAPVPAPVAAAPVPA